MKKQKANNKMELTTKAEPILGEFKGLSRLLWQLIFGVSVRLLMEKESRFPDDRYPRPGETCVITNADFQKRAALLFDRIHVDTGYKEDLFSEIPVEITFGIKDARKEAFRTWEVWIDQLSKAVKSNGKSPLPDKALLYAPLKGGFPKAYRKRGIEVVPLYSSFESFSSDFIPGKIVAFEGALQSLPLVVEHDIEWKQVLDFRKDPEAVIKYRSLRLWLTKGLEAESVPEAIDRIEMKIADYQWALRKHGLRTVTGAITHVLNPKNIATMAGSASFGAFIGGPVWSAITGGLVLTSQITTWVADCLLELEDIKRGKNSEVALIYDIRRRMGKKLR